MKIRNKVKFRKKVIHAGGKVTAKVRGTVSVLLAILLLPMMTVAGLVVDGSRVSSARSALSGAGELAANSVLAEYDRLLYEVYGLFAVSKDDEELTDRVCRYFCNSIENTGYLEQGDTYTREFINSVFGTLNSSVSAYRGLVDMSAGSFKVQSIPSSSIANPAVMEKQIVEYMKYRGPVLLADGLLTKLGCLKGLSAQTKAAQNKITYEKSCSGAMSCAASAYEAIESWLAMSEETGLPGSWETSAAGLNEAAGCLRTVFLCRAAAELFSDSFPDPGDAAETAGEIFPEGAAQGSGENLAVLTELLSSAGFSSAQALTGELRVCSALLPSSAWVSGADPETAEKGIADETDFLFRLKSAYGDLSYWYSVCGLYLEAVSDGGEREGDEGNGVYPREDEIEKAKALSGSFMKRVDGLIASAQDSVERLSEAVGTFANAGISKLYLDLYLPLSEQHRLLSEALSSLKELESAVSETEKDRKNWKGSIDSLEESSFKTEMESDYSSTDGFDLAGLKKLITVLESDLACFGRLLSGLSGIKLFGVKIPADTGVLKKSDLIRILDAFPEVDTSSSVEFLSASERLFSGRYTGGVERFEGYAGMMRFDPADTVSFGFYRELKEAFGTNHDSGTTERERIEATGLKDLLVKSASKPKEDTASGNQGLLPEGVGEALGKDIAKKIEELCGGASSVLSFPEVTGLAGSDDAELAESAASGLGSAASLLTGVKNIALASVEALYAEEYLTGMFSCLTDSARAAAGEEVLSISGIAFSGSPCFGAEAEYILCGLDSPSANQLSVKAMIFSVRFALNLIYVMTDSESRAQTLAVAEAIAGWTGFGAPLVQNVILAAWALAETGVDMSVLTGGGSVPIYKSKTTWTLGFAGLKKALVSEVAGAAATAVGDIFDSVTLYATNLTNENADRLVAELSSYADSTLDGICEDVKNMLAVPVEDLSRSLFSAADRAGIPEIASSLDSIFKSASEASGGLTGECLKIASEKLGAEKMKIAEEIFRAAGELSGPESTEEAINEKLFGKDGSGGIIGTLKKKISDAVKGEIKKYGDSFKKEVSELIGENSTRLKTELTERINSFAAEMTSDGGGKSGDSLKTAAGFSMNYKDYLRLFILISYPAKKNVMLKRAAEMMQLNLSAKKREKGSGFDITGCSTFFICTADIRVRTAFMDIPFTVTSGGKKKAVSLDYSNLGKGSRTLHYTGAASY